ncbi:MAG: hypothetical protein NWF05_11735 [Candidatus Bathyarchaeota archaeon]|nr:hypothetical protein [Candidatus Bathyarchaeota archaeon]
MSMDYTIIVYRREIFGDEKHPADVGAFVGDDEDYTFDCPNVDSEKTAVLFFRKWDVSFSKNIFTINGKSFDVGLTPNPLSENWKTEVLLVTSGILKAKGNVLHVESRNRKGGKDGNLDDFGIDNVVIYYKTL